MLQPPRELRETSNLDNEELQQHWAWNKPGEVGKLAAWLEVPEEEVRHNLMRHPHWHVSIDPLWGELCWYEVPGGARKVARARKSEANSLLWLRGPVRGGDFLVLQAFIHSSATEKAARWPHTVGMLISHRFWGFGNRRQHTRVRLAAECQQVRGGLRRLPLVSSRDCCECGDLLPPSAAFEQCSCCFGRHGDAGGVLPSLFGMSGTAPAFNSVRAMSCESWVVCKGRPTTI